VGNALYDAVESPGAFGIDSPEPDPQHAAAVQVYRFAFVFFHLHLPDDPVTHLSPCLFSVFCMTPWIKSS